MSLSGLIFDVTGIGNAIVDVLCFTDEASLAQQRARQRQHDAGRRGARRSALQANGPGHRMFRRLGGQYAGRHGVARLQDGVHRQGEKRSARFNFHPRPACRRRAFFYRL